jgi:gas vesicle protein
MATQSNSSSTKSSSKATKKSAPSRGEQARAAAQSAVDLPVGAVLEVSDRVAELVEPFSGRSAAEKQLKSYRTQLRRTAKRTERRGATARRRATTEARKTRSDVEQRVRKAIEEQTSRAQSLVDQVGSQLSALR